MKSAKAQKEIYAIFNRKTAKTSAIGKNVADICHDKAQKTPKPSHKIELDHLHSMSVTGVLDVPTFTDKNIVVKLADETLHISGQGLSVKNLDVESGKLQIEGRVDAIKYVAKSTPGSFAKRIFR